MKEETKEKIKVEEGKLEEEMEEKMKVEMEEKDWRRIPTSLFSTYLIFYRTSRHRSSNAPTGTYRLLQAPTNTYRQLQTPTVSRIVEKIRSVSRRYRTTLIPRVDSVTGNGLLRKALQAKALRLLILSLLTVFQGFPDHARGGRWTACRVRAEFFISESEEISSALDFNRLQSRCRRRCDAGKRFGTGTGLSSGQVVLTSYSSLGKASLCRYAEDLTRRCPYAQSLCTAGRIRARTPLPGRAIHLGLFPCSRYPHRRNL
ncbi:unnamed protein product [Nesidiocoris tenuis]|uniref:Uncharacterized protein n=1 Tax=Nesidiocoris tenuis TaxID=355587 RepID=A0A6H5HFX2_9HEMI|nr:unnamed protein product [Nesidiocoris tenuis]